MDVARYRHLSRAPLREALIDLRFEPAVPLNVIDRFVASIGDLYDKSTDLWTAVFGLSANGQGAAMHSGNTAVGRRLESSRQPYVLQCQVSGFTLSRLSPYADWLDLRKETHRLWESFRKFAGPLVVTRIAVRYINELRLPVPFADFGEYLTCSPQVPESLPQSLSGFLSRVIIPDDRMNCVSVVTQAYEGPPSDGPSGAAITVIFDIDVSRMTRLDGANDAEVWSGLDMLRDQKNRMFFEHLTEKTVEMYE
ncbi:TIGR04255 family protein [Ralstonia nicotianae]